jgi:hypothetical protein
MKRLACLAILVATVPAAAWADCTYPQKPGQAPDGSRATRAEMIAAVKVNQKYQADITAYLGCLKSEHDAAMAKNASASDDEKKKMTAVWEKKNDAAVDEAQEVADRINEQIRVCKARPDGCSK